MAKKTTTAAAAATATPAVADESPAAAERQIHPRALSPGIAGAAWPRARRRDGATERQSDEGRAGDVEDEGGGVVASAVAPLTPSTATLALTPRQQAAQSLSEATERVREIGDPLKWRNELNADFEDLIKEREAFLKDWQDRQNALQVQRQERFNRCQDLLEEKRLLELEVARLQKIIDAPPSPPRTEAA